MSLAVTPTVGATNGTPAPALPPELAEYPAMLAAVMAQTRLQLNARDASAEQHAWYWHRFAMWQWGVLAVAVLVIAWLVWDRREVQAFVQVVQVDEGRLVQIGVPQRLLDYTPAEGLWHDVMAEWLRRVYWRGRGCGESREGRLALGHAPHLPECPALPRWPEGAPQARQEDGHTGAGEH